uniref:Sulfhydryl oxidase n=1 Tax=Angiostrongylus cantonensis TaxID=6313 RepID=A0A158P986_ANGCA
MLLRWFLSSVFVVLIRFITSSSLYDPRDPVLELNTSSFNSAVYNSETAHVVEFYSSWCGACIAYAPTFKSFARHLVLWKPFVEVTVVDCANDFNLPLCRDHSVNAFPTIKYFKHHASNRNDGVLYEGNKYDIDNMELDVAGLLQADFENQQHPLRKIFHSIKRCSFPNIDCFISFPSIRLVFIFDVVSSTVRIAVSVKSQVPASVPLGNTTQYQVQLVDLKSTLSYMLFKVEFGDAETVDEHYTPGTTPMRRLLYRINEWLQRVDGRLAVDDWNGKLEEIQLALGNPLPKKIQWLACAGSKPNLRGYTCGLWTLAHVISVEAYKIEANNPSFNPLNEVMEPFHKFISHFLSCGECAKNFDKEAEKHKLAQVSTRDEMVMWFWRVHNFVNKRLSGSPSDDPLFRKRQFPPPVLCAQCYDVSGAFDETQVLYFLRTYYGNIQQDLGLEYEMNEYQGGKLHATSLRHLNPKFAVHTDKVRFVLFALILKKVELDASPQRDWIDIEGYQSLTYKSRTQLYLVWLSIIGFVIVFAYWKYRRNRSKFWKTFYYHSDFKMFPWSSSPSSRKYAV